MAPCTMLGSGQPYTLCGISFGALNHVRFGAAMYPLWYMARPARLERATCGFVVIFVILAKAIRNIKTKIDSWLNLLLDFLRELFEMSKIM